MLKNRHFCAINSLFTVLWKPKAMLWLPQTIAFAWQKHSFSGRISYHESKRVTSMMKQTGRVGFIKNEGEPYDSPSLEMWEGTLVGLIHPKGHR
jgi:hypothetical protein